MEYPAQIASLGRSVKVLKEYIGTDEERARRLENQLFSAQNSYKAITGYQRGLLDSALMAQKRTFERDFRARVARDPKLRARYADAWDAIARARTEQRSFARQARWYGFGGSQLLAFAGVLTRLPGEAARPDSLRLPAYRGPGLEALRTQVLTRGAGGQGAREAHAGRVPHRRRGRSSPRATPTSPPCLPAGARRWPRRR